MSEMSNEAIQAQIESRGLREGNTVKTSTGAINTTDANTPFYNDANAQLQAGGFPFAVPFIAGVSNTAASALSVEGFTTGSANAILTQTLVQGASGSLTTTGFIRVTITDDAGNLTNGAYYIPFGTLA